MDFIWTSYFVLTRDYLHCFKRATGSVNERISDMGQFIFKVNNRKKWKKETQNADCCESKSHTFWLLTHFAAI